MKYLKHIFLLTMCGLMIVSCADEPLPFETFEEMQHGAFARKLTDDGGDFFFTNPEGSAFSFSVEFYDENQGGDIASHDWYVWHRDNTAGTTTDPVLLISTPASSFGTDATSGLPTASYAFNLLDALAAMGLTVDDVNPGDDIIFDGFVVMNDGRSFGPDNTGSALQSNNGFDGIFRFQKSLKCASELNGTYEFSATAWCGNVVEGTVEFEAAASAGTYNVLTTVDGETFNDISFGTYRSCLAYASQGDQPNGDLVISDNCNKISIPGADQWGQNYSVDNVTVSGNVLTLDWSNGWDESASVVITRTDGTEWPALTF